MNFVQKFGLTLGAIACSLSFAVDNTIAYPDEFGTGDKFVVATTPRHAGSGEYQALGLSVSTSGVVGLGDLSVWGRVAPNISAAFTASENSSSREGSRTRWKGRATPSGSSANFITFAVEGAEGANNLCVMYPRAYVGSLPIDGYEDFVKGAICVNSNCGSPAIWPGEYANGYDVAHGDTVCVTEGWYEGYYTPDQENYYLEVSVPGLSSSETAVCATCNAPGDPLPKKN